MLASKIKKAIGNTKDGQTRLILEDGGAPVTLGLKVKDLFGVPICQFGDPECWVSEGKCGKMFCLYCIICNTCNEQINPNVRQQMHEPGGIKTSHYLGMTSTSLHNRQLVHRKGQFGDPECWVTEGKCGKMSCIYCIICNTCYEQIDPNVRQQMHEPLTI